MPLLLHPPFAFGAELALWQITEDERTLLALVPDAESEAAHLAGIGSERRRLEYLATRALLASLVGPAYSIGHEASGRPYLLVEDSEGRADRRDEALAKSPEFATTVGDDSAATPEISISHTEGYVAIILSCHHPVAVDVEHRAPRALRLAARFLSSDELPFFSTESLATLAWSAKETLFKRINTANVDFRDCLHLSAPVMLAGSALVRDDSNIIIDFSATPVEAEDCGIIPARVNHPLHQASYDVHFCIAADYVLTWID